MFQRKFAQESQEAKQDTFKRFREWLNETFVSGIPSEEEWQHIMKMRHTTMINQSTRNAVIVIPIMIVLVEIATLGMRIARKIVILMKDMHAASYNPEMHAFKKKTQVLYIVRKYLDRR